jgi:hypothetical protein
MLPNLHSGGRLIMIQQISKDLTIGSSKPSPPARATELEFVDTPVLDNQTNTLALQSSAGHISHKIHKIIKKSSVEYFCDECNTHYTRNSWVIEDHPDYDVKNYNVINIAKPQEVLAL